MDIYSILKTDHERLQELLDRLVETTESGGDSWKSLLGEIRDELVPHSRAEEAVFYNPIRETDQRSLITRSYAEHAVAETELRSLQAMKSINATWTALAKKLRDDVAKHVEFEEGQVFPAGRSVFSPEEAVQIGEAFTKLKPLVREQSFAGTSFDLVANLLPKRLRQGLHSYFANEKKAA